MNPRSVSVVYKWHERFRHGRNSTEDDLRDGRPCVVQMIIKDTVKDILFTPISKTLTKLDGLKQQSSNSTEKTSGRYVSILCFRDVFTVSQKAMVKLIVTPNCKDFSTFWLAACSPTCVAKVTYILGLAKNILF